VSSALSGNVVVWATGITARAIRFYISRGLLPPPEFRGNATRYGREHFLRLLAIRKFRREDRMGLEAIRRRLDSLDPAALEQFAPPAPAVAQTATAGLVAPPAATYKRESWERLALLPGLELLVPSGREPARAAARAGDSRPLCRSARRDSRRRRCRERWRDARACDRDTRHVSGWDRTGPFRWPSRRGSFDPSGSRLLGGGTGGIS